MPRKKFELPPPETEEEWEARVIPEWPELALATGPQTLARWLLEYFTNQSMLSFQHWDLSPAPAVTHGHVFVQARQLDDNRVEVVDRASDRLIFRFHLHRHGKGKSTTWLTTEYVDSDFAGELERMEAAAMREWRRVDVSKLPKRGKDNGTAEEAVRRYLDYRSKRKALYPHESEPDIRAHFCHLSGYALRTLQYYEEKLAEDARYDQRTKELRPIDP